MDENRIERRIGYFLRFLLFFSMNAFDITACFVFT